MNLQIKQIHYENNLSILFWLRESKPSKRTGLPPIYCRITLNGERASAHGFSTGITIKPENWNSKQQLVITGERASPPEVEQASLHNDRLQRIKMDIQKVFANFELLGNPFTALDIHDTYLEKPAPQKKAHSLKELVGKWEERYKEYVQLGEKAPRTFETYQSYNKMIIEYFDSEKKLQNFKTADFEDFRLSLRNQPITRGQNTGQTKGINYTSKILKHFGKLFELATELEWINRNPYQYQKAQRIKPETIFLHWSKLPELKNKVLGEKEGKARDIFLFLSHTGLSYKDYCALTNKSIIHKEGREFIFIEYRLKSPLLKRYGKSYIPIFPETRELLEKYGGIENLPKLEDCNKVLKYVWGRIDAPRNISLKHSRHTFINYAKAVLQLTNDEIATIVGHSDTRTTQESYLDDVANFQSLIEALKRANL